jgi:hypothetical protein
MHVQQLTTVCTWYIWRGATFSVLVTTLQRPKEQGGRALANIDIKCRTLLYSRFWLLSAREGSITTELMRKWEITGPIANPPNANGLPTMIPYICLYALDMAYAALPGPVETMKKFKHRVYEVLLTMAHTGNKTIEIRITSNYPELPWPRV